VGYHLENLLDVDALFSSLHDSLLTRLSNDDDMEKSLSTFANEMTSSAMILGLYDNLRLSLIVKLLRHCDFKNTGAH